MKFTLMAATLIAATLVPGAVRAYDAVADGWTPAMIACIRAVGYQPADWVSRVVPAGPAAKYRACRDKAGARAK